MSKRKGYTREALTVMIKRLTERVSVLEATLAALNNNKPKNEEAAVDISKAITTTVTTHVTQTELPIISVPRVESANRKINNLVTIWFDGGLRPSGGYGSYQIETNGALGGIVRIELLSANSANQAELMTLNAALNEAAYESNPSTTRLRVFGDSQLALHCSFGKWRTRHANILPIVEKNKKLLSEFADVSFQWQPREFSVNRFGH